jgi:hypothetical protein
MDWPPSLVAEVAERRCIIFLGAGASAACRDPATHAQPPGWKSLLNEAIAELAAADTRRLARRLLAREHFLDAAELIFSGVQDATSRAFFRQRFGTPRFAPSEIHEIVRDIDPKIVITTNYDTVYDEYCRHGNARDGYSVCRYYEKNVLDEIRSSARLVIKAHGCISDTSQMVLTRSQYFKARSGHPQFFSILDGLFRVNTLLFVGYGLADPDIALVLESAHISVPSRHSHYALVPQGRHPAIARAIKDTYNVTLLEYPTPGGTHEAGLTALRELRDLVESHRSTYR